MKVEHIGIAVKDLAHSKRIYEQLLHSPCYREETVESEGVITAFFKTENTKIELLAALTPESPIARFIEKRGEGIHHIAYEVLDIHSEMERLEKEGFRLLSKSPKVGAENKWVCFLHPKDCGGVLTELCMEIP